MMNVLRNIGYADLRPGDVYVNRHISREPPLQQDQTYSCVIYILVSVEHETNDRGYDVRLTWLSVQYGVTMVTTYARTHEIIPCERYRMFLREPEVHSP